MFNSRHVLTRCVGSHFSSARPRLQVLLGDFLPVPLGKCRDFEATTGMQQKNQNCNGYTEFIQLALDLHPRRHVNSSRCSLLFLCAAKFSGGLEMAQRGRAETLSLLDFERTRVGLLPRGQLHSRMWSGFLRITRLLLVVSCILVSFSKVQKLCVDTQQV